LNNKEIEVRIRYESDIAFVRQQAMRLTKKIGLTETDQAYVATSISELAANLFFHAIKGVIKIKTLTLSDQTGLEILSKDKGPGIKDINLALTDGYSTNSGLGSGLGGVRRMMDDFDIESTVGKGTRIAARIWRKNEILCQKKTIIRQQKMR
jgi:serine/threonine-protein kinase RsbT